MLLALSGSFDCGSQRREPPLRMTALGWLGENNSKGQCGDLSTSLRFGRDDNFVSMPGGAKHEQKQLHHQWLGLR
jgi:hypothetical protein